MKQVLNIAYYELKHILKDPVLFLIVFIAPLFYVTLFGAVYINGIITDIPLAIVDEDRSSFSREVVTAFKNDSNFKVVDEINTYTELENAMKEGIVKAGVVIPHNYERKILEHQQSPILSIYDGSNLVWGYNIRKNIRPVIDHVNDTYTTNHLAAVGLSQNEIQNIMNTVDSNIVTWYNPTFSYNNFLFMGLMIMVIHQLGLLSAGLTVTREKERHSWIQYVYSPIDEWKIALGKCLPYLLANFFNYTLLLWISSEFIQVKIAGNVFLIILLGLLFATIITFSGFFVSMHCSNSLQATRYLMLLSVPFFIISGFTWPATHIPALINGIARMLPYTWMTEGFRLITMKNAGLDIIGVNILVMTVMAGIALFLALNFKKEQRLIVSDDLTINGGRTYPRK